MDVKYWNMDLLNEEQRAFVLGQTMFESRARLFEINSEITYYIEMLLNGCEKEDIVFRRISFEEMGDINSITWFGENGHTENNYAPGERNSFIILTKRDIFEYFSQIKVKNNDEFLDNILEFKKAFGDEFKILRRYKLENYYYSYFFTADDFPKEYEYVRVFLDMITEFRCKTGREDVTRDEMDKIFREYAFNSIKKRKR